LRAATGLRNFFEPVADRVTPSTQLELCKPDRAVFERVLSRLQVKAKLVNCIFITASADHVVATRPPLGMQALQFATPGMPAPISTIGRFAVAAIASARWRYTGNPSIV